MVSSINNTMSKSIRNQLSNEDLTEEERIKLNNINTFIELRQTTEKAEKLNSQILKELSEKSNEEKIDTLLKCRSEMHFALEETKQYLEKVIGEVSRKINQGGLGDKK